MKTATKFIMIGAGGHARVLADAMRAAGLPLTAVASLDQAAPHGVLAGLPHMRGDDDVLALDARDVVLVNGVGSIGDVTARYAVFDRFHAAGFTFASILHPTAIIASDVEIGEGAQLMAGVVVQPGCHIGDNVILNTRASIDHDCFISDHAHLAPGTALSGNVTIGTAGFVGVGACIMQGVSIGAWSTIAAGSAVVADVPDGILAGGVPARQIKATF